MTPAFAGDTLSHTAPPSLHLRGLRVPGPTLPTYPSAPLPFPVLASPLRRQRLPRWRRAGPADLLQGQVGGTAGSGGLPLRRARVPYMLWRHGVATGFATRMCSSRAALWARPWRLCACKGLASLAQILAASGVRHPPTCCCWLPGALAADPLPTSPTTRPYSLPPLPLPAPTCSHLSHYPPLLGPTARPHSLSLSHLIAPTSPTAPHAGQLNGHVPLHPAHPCMPRARCLPLPPPPHPHPVQVHQRAQLGRLLEPVAQRQAQSAGGGGGGAQGRGQGERNAVSRA